MALELNGTTGVSLVQDGVVTAADLASTLDLTGKTVTLPSGTGGKVIQVVSAENTTRSTTTGNTLYDVVTVNITPTSASNTIVLLGQFFGCCAASYDQTGLFFRRNTTKVGVGTDGGGYNPVSSKIHQSDSSQAFSHFIMDRDNPASTSSITYRMTVTDANNDNTIYVNRSYRDGSGTADPTGFSMIVAMEIAA